MLAKGYHSLCLGYAKLAGSEDLFCMVRKFDANSAADLKHDDSTSTSDKKSGKRKRDPNLPKRAQNAYNYFMTEMSHSIRENLATDDKFSVAEVSKVVASKWKELSDEEKAVSLPHLL